MKPERLFVTFAVAVAVLLVAMMPTLASVPDRAFTAQLEPGNYCASCHTAADDRPAAGCWPGPAVWTGK